MISKKVDLMGNFTLFRDVFFGLLIFFIFAVPDYLISVPWELPCIQFCAYTILLSLTRVALFVYLLLFYIEKILKKDCIKFKLERPTVNSRWFLAALLIPLSVIALFFIFVKGKFIVNYDFSENVKHIIYGLFKVGLCSAIAEEFLFRGFLFTIFENKFNKKAAIVITSLLFASLHLFGMNSLFDVMSVLVAGTVVGVMFSLIARETDSIWNAITVHTMWNFVTSKLIRLSISEGSNAVATYVLRRPNILIFNANIGIETSIFTLLCYLIVILIILQRKSLKKLRG